MVKFVQKYTIAVWVTIFALVGCTPSVTPDVAGAIVPTRQATATATATATITPSPTATATITPTPTPDVLTIDLGETLILNTDGSLTVNDWRVRYTFIGNAGDALTVEMNSNTANLDPYLILLDEGGNRLSDNDNVSADSNNARISNYVLPRDGTYTVLATRQGEAEGDTTGAYQLNFRRLPDEYYDVDNGIFLIPLIPDTNVIGQIDADTPFETYTFGASNGDVITVEMNSTSGTLDSYLILVNRQTRTIIAENDDTPDRDSRDASLNSILITEEGEYILIATRYQGVDGMTAGDFTLRFNLE
ncbi:MAG: PPC domain-containing protein [Anaerolineae bacterium]